MTARTPTRKWPSWMSGVAALALLASGCAARMTADEFEQRFRIVGVREPVPPASQDDTETARLEATERYFEVHDIQQLLDSTIHEAAKSLSDAERRELFHVTRDLDAGWFKRTMSRIMTRYYTRREIMALAHFYGTPEGRAIARKLGTESGPSVPAEDNRDTALDRRVAAQRFLSTIDLERFYGGLVTGLALAVPPHDRETFYGRAHSNFGRMPGEMEELLTRYYTRREIDAMTRFYSTAEGASIMAKVGVVLREFMSEFLAYISPKLQGR